MERMRKITDREKSYVHRAKEVKLASSDHSVAYGTVCLLARICMLKLLIRRSYNSTEILIVQTESLKKINIMCLLNYNLCGKSILYLLRKIFDMSTEL